MVKRVDVRIEKDFKYFDVDDLTPLQGKLKGLSDENFNKLRKSILEKGFKLVLHVWQSGGVNYLIDGHQRAYVLQQLKKQGYEVPEIPCAMVQARTYSEAKETVLLAVSQYGKLDKDGFDEFIEGEDFELDDFDFPDVGADFFDVEETDEEKKEREDKEDSVPDIPENDNPYGVQRGQVWKLGKHRIMCGDSTSEADVAKLMGGKKASITFTSPPYNAGSFGYDEGKSKYKEKGGDSKNQDDYLEFLIKFVDLSLDVSPMILFNNQFLSGNRHALGKFIGHYADKIKDVFPWIKNTAPPNVNKGVFTNRFEFIICLENNNTKRGFDCDWQGKYHNVIEGHTASKENVTKGSHSATMPLYVPEFFIERLSFIKSIYEPFCGSGTTLIACEKTGRRCYGMEIDVKYMNVIIKRWEEYTGETAERIE